MTKVAIIAFMPTAAVLFGIMAIAFTLIPGLTHHFDAAFGSYMTAAVLSVVIAAPIAWLIASRMTTRRDRRVFDAESHNAH